MCKVPIFYQAVWDSSYKLTLEPREAAAAVNWEWLDYFTVLQQSSQPGRVDSTPASQPRGCGFESCLHHAPFYTVFSEQRAKNKLLPLPQRQNVKKFEHENGWWFA